MSTERIQFDNFTPKWQVYQAMKTSIKTVLPEPVVQTVANVLNRSRMPDELPTAFPTEVVLPLGDISGTFEIHSLDEYRSATYATTYEKEILNRFMELVEGKTVWDVGAAFGVFSVSGALAGAKEMLAFEPDPEIFTSLEKNIRLNNAANTIMPLRLALSDTCEELTLHTSGRDGKAPSVMYDANYFSRNEVVTASTVSHLVEDRRLNYPDIIKIDVEGYELSVLNGFGQIRPEHIFLEMHPIYGADTYAIGTWFGQHGYKFQWGTVRGNEILVHMKR